MNKQRRKEIETIINELEDINKRLMLVLAQEEVSFESMPEHLHLSFRGVESQEWCRYLHDAYMNLAMMIYEGRSM